MHLLPPKNVDRKRLTSADGTRIYADAVGDPANPAILFAHGFGGCAEIFNDIFSESKFSEKHYLVDTIVLGLRG